MHLRRFPQNYQPEVLSVTKHLGSVVRIGTSFKGGAGRLEVCRQFITHPPPIVRLRNPQSSRRMVGCQDRLSPFGRKHFAAILRDSKISPDERLGSRRPQADDHAGTHDADFRFQPRAAGRLFPGTWL